MYCQKNNKTQTYDLGIAILKDLLLKSPRSDEQDELSVFGYIRTIAEQLELTIPACLMSEICTFYRSQSLMDGFTHVLLMLNDESIRYGELRKLISWRDGFTMLMKLDLYDNEFTAKFKQIVIEIYRKKVEIIRMKYEADNADDGEFLKEII